MSVVPFRYLAHLVTIPVLAGGRAARFVVDTGIGVTLISESLAAQAVCGPTGSTYTGRRMSGHPVTLQLGSLSSLRVGDLGADDVTVGILDMSKLAGLDDMSKLAGLDRIDGFLGLDCFRSTPVTIDYPAEVLVVEDAGSLAQRAQAGVPAGVRVEHDRCSTSVFLPLEVPGAGSITVEVDTGSDALILSPALAQDLGVDLAGPGIRTVEGRDETGHAFVRYFATIRGMISVTGAPAVRQADPEVMFQKIIYDGLVGNAFLRNFVVTYDLPNTRMIFAAAADTGEPQANSEVSSNQHMPQRSN